MEASIVEIEHAIPFTVEPPHSGSVHTVAELLPEGHEQYLRLFHPFVPWEVESGLDPVETQVRWCELAEQAGTTFSATTTWRTIKPVLPVIGDSRPWAVWEGELEAHTADELFGTLDQGTSGPFYFEFGLVAIVNTNGTPRLYRSASIDGRRQAVEHIRSHGGREITTPSLSWSHDQRWITCSDYDLTSTYVATDTPTANRLLANPSLEILEVERTTRIDNKADEQMP